MKNFNSFAKYILKNEPFRLPAFARKFFAWFIFWGMCFLQPQYLYAQCSVAFTHCPSSITIIDCDHSGDAIIQYPTVIANTSGFCSGYTITQTSGPVPGSLVPLGTYLISFNAQAQDLFSSAISTVSCNFFVSIIADLTPPTFINCPPNITLTGIDDGTGNCTAQAFWTNPTASDACGNTVIAGSAPCGTFFPMGSNTVIYTATDESNNSATCSFTVTVICVVGTSEAEKNLFPIRLSPNPNSGSFTLELPQPATPDMDIKVFDLTGQIQLDQRVEVGATQQMINMTSLPSGMYFVQIWRERRVVAVEKFVRM